MQSVLLRGQKQMSPQVESVLTMESLLWDGVTVFQHQKNPVEVKHCHLKCERARRIP